MPVADRLGLQSTRCHEDSRHAPSPTLQSRPRQAPAAELGRLNAWRFLRHLRTLRGLLFGLLGVLALAVIGLLLVLVTTAPAGSPASQGRARSPAPLPGDTSNVLSEAAVPDVEAPSRRPVVLLPPRPQPPRLRALELSPTDDVSDAALQEFLREVDILLTALDPSTSYVGLLATQALRGETSRLRVIVESGGTASALADIQPARRTSQLPADAQTLALLLRSILVTGASGQQSLLTSVTGQPAVSERIQEVMEARALGRFIEVHEAVEFAAELRNSVVHAAAETRG